MLNLAHQHCLAYVIYQEKTGFLEKGAMGTDFEARKMAKSQRKRASSEQPKRVRKKKNPTRRLCRGM
jgi:hypothetical protein